MYWAPAYAAICRWKTSATTAPVVREPESHEPRPYPAPAVIPTMSAPAGMT